MPDSREPYGRIVRETWANWAREQVNPKPGWLTPWEKLDAGQREVDMRIGSAVAAQARRDALLNLTEAAIERASAELVRITVDTAVAAERERIRQLALAVRSTCACESCKSFIAGLTGEPS